MAYTTPRTWVALEYPTAAQFNTHIRDNVAFLANPPACRVHHNANQSIPNNAATALAFNSERYDTDGMHSTVTNNSRITIVTAGLYQVFCTIEFTAHASGYRQGYIRLNGTTPILVNSANAAPVTIGHQMSIAGAWKFAATDYIEVIVRQTTGGALDVTSGASYTPEFGATWIGLG